MLNYNNLILKILLLCFLLFLVSCSTTMRHSIPNINQIIHIDPASITLGDSIAIEVYLNDTVFTMSDLRIKQGPSMSFNIVNLYDHDILLPKEQYYVGSIPNNPISGISIIVGQDNELVIGIQVLGKKVRSEEYFVPFRKNESMSFSNIEIMPQEYYSRLEPGIYWTYLIFSNYDWQEMSLPVWIGDIQSDTLWFRVK